ncbi:High-affinity nickel-transport protein [Haladaptatus litoreus]|uniref:High-affinity nickel-transport protein n=1 Tax=Haladaptatus litoreus TaxID=553468 RepID=A0A1N7CZ20_9EURY|nr:hypothetical protein [Haladaptatus litoreus]SIR68780.1 High-affinity nickel-transport protein [Haladaptatus litoreus]
MLHTEAFGLLVGAIALGAFHGIEPGHGWPVAAAYALDQTNKWLSGFAASFILGVGHLISSLVMVAIFFYAKSYFSLTQVNEPIPIDLFSTTIYIGGPVSLVAGVLLILLGIREYYGGHSHGTNHSHGDDSHTHNSHPHDEDAHTDHSHGHDHDGHTHAHGEQTHNHDLDHGDGHDHDRLDLRCQTTVQLHKHDESSHNHMAHHDDHTHDHEGHAQESEGLLARIKGVLPFVGGHSHDHSHGDLDEAAERGLFGIAWFAFVLGFAHEEEFEIIAMCAGSNHCLELMSAYAITVIAGIVGLTMLLIAGYHSYEEKVERYTPYLPVFSAVVLIIMGFGFITGLF